VERARKRSSGSTGILQPGERKTPIAFDKFHGYTGTVDYLKAVSKAYPEITELVEIGKSFQQRPIYVLVITNKKTGTTLDREKSLVHERKLEVTEPPITALHAGVSGNDAHRQLSSKGLLWATKESPCTSVQNHA
jgi:hypothetical protein